jgi:hypothetical protein
MSHKTKNGINDHGVVKGAKPLLNMLRGHFGEGSVGVGTCAKKPKSSRRVDIKQLPNSRVGVSIHVDGALQKIWIINTHPTAVLLFLLSKLPETKSWEVYAEGVKHTLPPRAP